MHTHTIRILRLLTVFFFSTLALTSNAQGVVAELSDAQELKINQHIETAYQLASTDLVATYDFFCVPGNARPNNFNAPALTPVKLFDNLYAMGNSETVVHAITTSEGIILIDAGSSADVETLLIPGLEALGLNPADVKYILLGHGHGDHFGGAAYFQNNYGARVGTTSVDWETIAESIGNPRNGDSETPERDMVIENEEPIVLGDVSITPILIPGHTPGALAFIFNVTDHGEDHVAGLFGGTVLAANWVSTSGLEQYVDSIARFLTIAESMGVDVEVQNHPIFDDTPSRLAALAEREQGDPNPFVMGSEKFQRFWTIISECMKTELIKRGEEE